jgi:hypothetical protein
MHKLTRIPGPSTPTRSRSNALPDLASVETLISQARGLRLELTRLATFELITESARAGADALTQVGLALEKIAELLVSSRNRPRRSRAKTSPPDSTREEDHLTMSNSTQSDYACVACGSEYGVGFWTRANAGPFCDECWETLNEPDQALLTEERLAQAEAEIARLHVQIKLLKGPQEEGAL